MSKPFCDFCKDTGQHLCPDVAQPILVSCSKKGCPFAELKTAQAKIAELEAENAALKAEIESYQRAIELMELK